MNGRKLEPKAMKFIAERHGALFDVTVYVPGFTTREDFGNILFIALDHVVGEYDMETRIGGIEWASRPMPASGLRPRGPRSLVRRPGLQSRPVDEGNAAVGPVLRPRRSGGGQGRRVARLGDEGRVRVRKGGGGTRCRV
ncbi:MAG: hypothetical protein IPJ34_34585 [Myxococcales bacterium]|nr:hypothetical protein [Myxococcales bacterium]